MAKKPNLSKRYTNLYVKRRLLKLEIDVFSIISNGLVQNLGKAKILAQVRKLIRSISVQVGLDEAEQNLIWNTAYATYIRSSRQTSVQLRKLARAGAKGNAGGRAEAVYSSIRAIIQKNDLIKASNQVMYMYEFRMKHEEVYQNLLGNNTSPFFLCSSHPKPAKDHAGWEGKVYYDEDWEKKGVWTDEEKSSIRAYIRNHKLRTVQWVCGEPVYLVTRRNCKHYLKELPIEEVLHASARSLLRKHGMYMKDEVPASREVLTYREYYNRLKIEESLHSTFPNEILAQDIKKDRKLLEKWRNML